MEKHKPQLKHLPRFLKKQWLQFIVNVYRKSVILPKFFIPINTIWRWAGVNMGKNVVICLDVYLDVGNANLLTIEDNVGISPRALLFMHKRDLSQYFKNELFLIYHI